MGLSKDARSSIDPRRMRGYQKWVADSRSFQRGHGECCPRPRRGTALQPQLYRHGAYPAGVVRETEGVAARVLANLGVDLSKVRSCGRVYHRRGERPAQGEIGHTPRAKKVVELAVDEARRMNHTYIGTEHLLSRLLREGEGVAAGVLESLNVSLDKVRSETYRILSQSSATPSGSGGRALRDSHPNPRPPGYRPAAAARANKLDPVIGRSQEIQRVIQILSRRTKNNPVLMGEPGVGKTAIVEALAQRIAGATYLKPSRASGWSPWTWAPWWPAPISRRV